MACPYFYPVARIDRGIGARALPLGDAWSGDCQADSQQILQPDERSLIPLCNLGYAQICAHFPENGSADAVRFSVSRDQDRVLRISYVIEKAYEPVEHGSLVYSQETGAFLLRHANRLVQRQAEAYVESYLVRTAPLCHAQPESSNRI